MGRINGVGLPGFYCRTRSGVIILLLYEYCCILKLGERRADNLGGVPVCKIRTREMRDGLCFGTALEGSNNE